MNASKKAAEKKNDSTTLVNFRIDQVVKDSAEAVLAGMGLSASAYVGMCLRKLAQDKGVPFEPTVDPEFWIVESAVSGVMESIESGLFADAVDLFHSAQGRYAELMNDYILSDDTDDAVKASAALYLSINRGSLIEYYKTLRVGANTFSTSGNRDEVARILEETAEYIEERAVEIMEEHDIDIENAPEHGASTEGWMVVAVADVLERAMNEYEEHRDQLSMRFVSPKADQDDFETIRNLSEMRKQGNGDAADLHEKLMDAFSAKLETME